MDVVLGATGTNGRLVVKHLLAAGRKVRAVVRDSSKQVTGAESAVADLSDAESLKKAFAGGSTLFLLVPVALRQVDLELDAIRVARDAGIGRVVKLSAIGADPLAAGHFSRSHGIAESALKDSGLGWTIVRGAFFYSNLMFAAAAIKQGVYPGHWSDHSAAWVDPADLSAVCAACLIDPSTAGQTVVATGPVAMTNAQVAQQLTTGLGRPVRYVDQSPEEYRKAMIAAGMPDWLADAEIALRTIVVSGSAIETTDVVRRLTARPPRSIQQYIVENKSALA